MPLRAAVLRLALMPPVRWLRDAAGERNHGAVSATDTAFMSTSRNRGTPIHYMGGDDNVLWELEPCEEPTDSAYHCGADIRLLSQYPAEEEVPCPQVTSYCYSATFLVTCDL